MLGSMIRAAISVPQDRMDVLAKIASAMAADNPNGNEWHSRFKELLKNPFEFERNEHGHIIVTVIGLDLTGAQEIACLEKKKYRISDRARQMFTSTNPDGYNAKHRLVAGQTYKIVLFPGKQIVNSCYRTTSNLCVEAKKLGYGKPLASIVPRIRETISDEQMKKMEFWFIAALHDPITDAVGHPEVLLSDISDDDRRLLGSDMDNPDRQWNVNGAFAFVLPAS